MPISNDNYLTLFRDTWKMTIEEMIDGDEDYERAMAV